MKRRLVVVIVLGLTLVCVAACGQTASANPPSSSSGSANVVAVHMGMQSFKQSSVTIKQGQSLDLVNDSSNVHLISLGQWVNGSPKAETEAGAPQVHNLEFTAQASHTVGPWNTPGTYHLYCTIHQNMQLTVIVQ